MSKLRSCSHSFRDPVAGRASQSHPWPTSVGVESKQRRWAPHAVLERLRTKRAPPRDCAARTFRPYQELSDPKICGIYSQQLTAPGVESRACGCGGNYWVYSAGLAVAWAVVFAIRTSIGDQATMDTVLKVFAGFVVGWISTTIARYLYPPPAKRTNPHT